MPSPDVRFEPLTGVARASISEGQRTGAPLEVDLERFDPALRVLGASFVTLHIGDALRGCTGRLEPVRPLVADVAYHAFCAAFLDPRFEPLREEEHGNLRVHVSVLSPRKRLSVSSEDELLAALRPGVDGLVLEEGGLRATFLPAVWAQLPSPRQFLQQLRLKAGLPLGYWSKTLRVSRYTVQDVEDQERSSSPRSERTMSRS